MTARPSPSSPSGRSDGLAAAALPSPLPSMLPSCSPQDAQMHRLFDVRSSVESAYGPQCPSRASPHDPPAFDTFFTAGYSGAAPFATSLQSSPVSSTANGFASVWAPLHEPSQSVLSAHATPYSHTVDGMPPTAALPDPAEDVIPNAIVIKNIPFSLPKDALTSLMISLHLPVPYAFNYHYDQGVFRGLAFANFHSAQDADQVVAALNGFDVSGRKLKAQYKKVLQAGQKERIEKEKALKRMQSFQIEKKERRHRQQLALLSHSLVSGNPLGSSSPSPASIGLPPLSANGETYRSPAGVGVGAVGEPVSSSVPAQDELNMNDPTTLDIYSRVLLFCDDRMRDELTFSKNLSPSERRVVHLVAQRLGLYHYSIGHAEERCAVVKKHDPTPVQRTQVESHYLPPLGRQAKPSFDSSLPYVPEGDMVHTQARLASMRSYAVLGRQPPARPGHRSMIVPPSTAAQLPKMLADMRLDRSPLPSPAPASWSSDSSHDTPRLRRSSPLSNTSLSTTSVSERNSYETHPYK